MLVNASLVITGVLLMTLGAYMRIETYPVPITLQTLAVFLVAGSVGLSLGVTSTAIYLALGSLGAPVFAGTNMTTGFLIGFLLAAILMGLARDFGMLERPTSRVVALIYATAIVFVPGVLWLAFITLGSLEYALAGGLFPFIPGAIVKITAAAVLIPPMSMAIARVRD
jgi:biotin transport system substrate-specific component